MRRKFGIFCGKMEFLEIFGWKSGEVLWELRGGMRKNAFVVICFQPRHCEILR